MIKQSAYNYRKSMGRTILSKRRKFGNQKVSQKKMRFNLKIRTKYVKTFPPIGLVRMMYESHGVIFGGFKTNLMRKVSGGRKRIINRHFYYHNYKGGK